MKELIERLMPGRSGEFVWEIEPSLDGFEISARAGKISLRARDLSTLSAALGDYLRTVAGIDLAWLGDGLDRLPAVLPRPEGTIARAVPQKYRSAFNYCTFSYTMVWWDWARWERELDHMALSGVNLPLMTVGLEGVWYDTLLEFGLSDEEARSFLCGPAFLAWQWLTNIESFCGPLPKSWIDDHVALGRRIIARMRELGMTPIMQGPSGLCPRLFKEKFPDANIRFKPEWNNIGFTAEIDPLDPLFARLGETFLRHEKALFGAYGFYASDPFHEGYPPVDTPEYLHAVGEGIVNILKKHDENYTWVLQAWSLRKDIIMAAPKEHVLVLDLRWRDYAHDACFWGYPFVTGTLNNFGGNVNAHGDMAHLAANPFLMARAVAPNCVGTGVFMEGIERNVAYYELAYDMLTRAEPVDLDKWMEGYCDRRYGGAHPAHVKAWRLLRESAYAPGTDGVERASIVCARPSIHPRKSGPSLEMEIAYDTEKFNEAVRLLLSAPADTAGYRADAVDLRRQVISNAAQRFYPHVTAAIEARDAAAFEETSARFMGMLDDMDRLLYLSDSLRLDKWLDGAVSCAHTDAEAALYEWNARVQITLWGFEENSTLYDYAWKEWAGLIKDFYMGRWQRFFDMIRRHPDYTDAGLPDDRGREAWRADGFYSALADWESAWTHSRVRPEKRAVSPELIGELAEKYLG